MPFPRARNGWSVSDGFRLRGSFWTGPRSVAQEGSWLAMRGVSVKKGVDAKPGNPRE